MLCAFLVALGWYTTQSASADDSQTADQVAASSLRGIATNIQYNKDGTVRLVRLSKSQVTAEHVAIVGSFSRLDYLAIVCPQLTDDDIAPIANLTQLDTLLLSETAVSDSGIAAIDSLRQLQRLSLDRTRVGDPSMATVAKLTRLESLSLVNTSVSDEGVQSIEQLSELESLRLDHTKITDRAIQSFSQLKNLRWLSLAGCQVRDISGLTELAHLEHLCLNATNVDDSVLDFLGNMKSLKVVEMFGTRIRPTAVRQLRKRRPDLYVAIDAGRDESHMIGNFSALDTAQNASKPRQQVEPSIKAVLEDEVAAFSYEAGAAPDFQRHVIPLLGRLGCNSRSCHGSFQGQGGFRLSMFGYDFEMDHENLLPRVDLDDPDASQIVLKPTSDDEHEGGQRFKPGSWQQSLLRQWIAGGAKGLAEQPPRFVRLEVTPNEIVFDKLGETAELTVVAVWSDGRREDVTCLTRFESKDDAIAEVTKDGAVTARGAGDTHVIATYDNGIVPVAVLLPAGEKSGDAIPQVSSPNKIDELVNAKIRKLGIAPSGPASDEVFLRRLSLDLIGTLPSPDEVVEFLADDSPDKRDRKIDELLGDEAYVVWWTNLLCDLTGSNAGYLGGTEMARPVAKQWRDWIELRVRENVGWDKIAEGIITATSRRPGQSYARYVAEQSSYTRPGDTGFAELGNPMPHFWYRDNISIPSDKALAFAYTFMGVRLDCAQCHKHPFDQWSKRDFDQFTQFFTRIKKGVAPDARALHENMRHMLGVPAKLNTAALRRQSYLRVAAEGREIPWNEIYIDPPSDEPQMATLLGTGTELDLNELQDPRRVLFQWLIHEPKRYFAKAMVNRVWAHYFNVGIVDPTDDLNLANPPSNAALLSHLADQFVRHQYDMRWLHRTILRSETYQRSWKTTPSNVRDERHYSHSVVRRLPAEVAIDALIQATANDTNLRRLRSDVNSRKITQHPKSYQTRSIDYSLLVFGKPLRSENCDCQRQNEPTLVQALFLRNDSETIAWLDRKEGWIEQLKHSAPESTSKNELVEQAYLRVLSRFPKDAELLDCVAHLKASESTTEGMRDLLWALLNTQEFVTNH